MDRRLPLLIVTLLLAGCVSVAIPTPTATPTVTGDPGVPADGKSWNATVVDVVDGDTIDVRYPNGTTDTVRLVGIDTPETYGPSDPADFEGVPDTKTGLACLADAGERASRTMTRWLNGTQITLVHDPLTDVRDRYGRLLAYVVHDGTNVNYRLVARGYARVYDTEFRLAATFYAAESRAQEKRLGLWECIAPSSWNVTNGLRIRVVADAPGNDNEQLNGESVVIENVVDEPQPIGGWTVEDAAGHRFTFPPNTTIPADGSVTVHSGTGTNTATTFYWGSDGAIWNNGGDTMTLRNEAGVVVITRSY